jgi:hypothetical protein
MSPTELKARLEAHLQSVPGDFYVVNGECLSCGAPQEVAPDLIGWAANSEYEHCIWKKQPETMAEMEQAIAGFNAACCGSHRYAGSDPAIMSRIGPAYWDHAPLPPADLHLTLIEEPHGIAGRFLAALFLTAVSVFLIWLFAMR